MAYQRWYIQNCSGFGIFHWSNIVFRALFDVRAIPVEQSWYYLTNCRGDQGVHTFSYGINPKLNAIARLLTMISSSVTTTTTLRVLQPPQRIWVKKNKKFWEEPIVVPLQKTRGANQNVGKYHIFQITAPANIFLPITIRRLISAISDENLPEAHHMALQ